MLELVNNFFGNMVTLYCCVLFGKKILNGSYLKSKINIFFLLISFSLLFDLLYLIDFPLLRTIASFVLYFLIFRFVFGIKEIKNLISTILFFALLFAGEVILFIILTSLFKSSGNDIYIKFGGSLFANILVSLISYFLSLIFKNIIIKLLNFSHKKNNVIYLFIMLCCLIVFLIFSFSSSKLNLETIFVLSMIFVMTTILFISFYQLYKNSELTSKYDKLLDFIREYEDEIEKQRTLRHEVKNQLLIIKSKIIDNDKQKNVIKYIDEVIKDNNVKINHVEYAKLKYLPSNGIKGLFYFKMSEAISKNINVRVNVSKSIENSILYKLSSNMFNQVGKLLGIFLDNAIESCIASGNKEMGIEVYNVDGNVEFIISNFYSKDLLSKINDVSKSSKGENRGHGLLLAKAIVKSNNRLYNDTTITEELYVQKLVIKNKS